jgi:hypothetical protein
MGKINMGRVLVGGIVAGIVLNILGYIVDGLLLAGEWSEGFKALGLSNMSVGQIIWINLFNLLAGIFIVWIYAAIRPRFGPGMKTAIIAGLAVWAIGVFWPNIAIMWIAGLFHPNLTIHTTLGGIIECVAAALAGGFLYREPLSA